jgi:hypothetical protein
MHTHTYIYGIQKVDGGNVTVERFYFETLPSVTDVTRWFLTGRLSAPATNGQKESGQKEIGQNGGGQNESGEYDSSQDGRIKVDLLTFWM